MEEFGDISVKISGLIGNLDSHLDETTTKIEKLEQLSKKLVLEDELALLQKAEQAPGIDPETHMIRTLEDHRAQLVMDIQAQDYIRDKLQELIEHNSEMVSSVKDYLENKPTFIKDEYSVINQRVKHYIDGQTKPNIFTLEANTRKLASHVSSVEKMMADVFGEISKNNAILTSPEYQAQLNTIVSHLNEIKSHEMPPKS